MSVFLLDYYINKLYNNMDIQSEFKDLETTKSGDVMEEKLKTRQKLFLEVEELRSRLESAGRHLKEITDQRQMEEALKISETR